MLDYMIKPNSHLISSKIMLLYGLFIIYLAVIIRLRCNINYVNILFFFISLSVSIYAINDINKNGVATRNLFLLVWFVFLGINNINLSNLQVEKSLFDGYYFIIGPLVFSLFLSTNIKIRKICIDSHINIPISIIALIISILYLIGQAYIIYRTGARFFASDWIFGSEKYVIPGLSGIVVSLKWLSFMLFPEIRNRIVKFLVVACGISSSLLSAKRGDVMRIMIFLLLYFLFVNGNKGIRKSMVVKTLAVILLIVVVFTLLGNYRQYRRGWTKDDTQSKMIESRIDNEYLSWLYGYSSIDFDVLKQIYIDADNHPYVMMEVFRPIIRVIKGNEEIEKLEENMKTHGLNGYNASTFLAPFVYEMGAMYILSVIILGIIIGAINIICCSSDLKGGVVYLAFLNVLAIFGNYYLEPSFLFPLIAYILIMMLFKRKASSNVRNELRLCTS